MNILLPYVENTAYNTVISPNYMVFKFCGKAQFPSETTRKLSLSTKFSHREIRWNSGILRSENWKEIIIFSEIIKFHVYNEEKSFDENIHWLTVWLLPFNLGVP